MKNRIFLSSAAWWAPAVFLLLLTPFLPSWDLELSAYAFQGGSFSSHPFFQFFYDWGEYPALTVAVGSLVVLLGSFFSKKELKWRIPALYLLLTFVIGSGVITNLVFKEYWGRPRPKQLIEFGGDQTFRPYYSPNFTATEPLKSFPCGHCTTGFYFFSLVFLGRRLKKSWVSILGWCLAWGLGLCLSLSRIFQGGHFLSDTLVGALVMWYTALILDRIFYSES